MPAHSGARASPPGWPDPATGRTPVKSRKRNDPLYARIRDILESARSNVARSVNTTQVIANWLIGREIVQEEQRGQGRAGYAEELLSRLSRRLSANYGQGFSISALQYMRSFFQAYPALLPIQPAARVEPERADAKQISDIQHALRVKSSPDAAALVLTVISDAPRRKSWKPGSLHSNLSWTHYRTLLRVDDPGARSFYEIESINNNWSARELERQINSLLYQRLAMSRDKKGLLRLAKKGHQVQSPTDLFKDPLVMEFLGLPTSPKLVESDLEEALIDNLQAFLLELGNGFAFVARQQRITLDGDHFFIDLVFYHTILKCFVLIDLKVGKLTHEDLGQLQLYVNYYDRQRLSTGDNPTLGLILCTDKNDAVVKYTLGQDQADRIFASRYRLHVPSEAELKKEIRRELRALERGSVGSAPRTASPIIHKRSAGRTLQRFHGFHTEASRKKG
jgi:predicted nuclease of restriction endonuclease-like (RecB) superfamily